MAVIQGLIVSFLLLLLGTCAQSVNPAYDAGFNTEPTPIYAGSVLTSTFNSGTGPRNIMLFFDATSPPIYNTDYVYVSNATDGLVMVADVGPVIIYLQATIQYGATWSNDESSPVLVNLVINGVSAGISPLLNSGPSSTYSMYKYINYALFNGGTVEVNLQYNSNDAPQFSNFFISITPMS